VKNERLTQKSKFFPPTFGAFSPLSHVSCFSPVSSPPSEARLMAYAATLPAQKKAISGRDVAIS
jgi:hypothetical protein